MFGRLKKELHKEIMELKEERDVWKKEATIISSLLSDQITENYSEYIPQSLAAWRTAIDFFGANSNYRLICHPVVFEKLMELCVNLMVAPSADNVQTIFGIDIQVDQHCKGWYFQEKTI